MILSNILLQASTTIGDSIAARAAQLAVERPHAADADSLKHAARQAISQAVETNSWDKILEVLQPIITQFVINLVTAIVVFYVGRFVIKRLYRLLNTILVHREVEPSLSTFLLSATNISLNFLLIIWVISVLGIETSSFIAIFASAGVAVGMALSGTLQNFAGGVLILFIKPFKVGDYIEYDTYKGIVKEIQIFNTIILTYNNERIIIPNGGLSTGTVNNFSAESLHRIEWHVGISYGDDVEQARKVIMDILSADSRVLKVTPALAAPVGTGDGEQAETAGGSHRFPALAKNKVIEKVGEWRQQQALALEPQRPDVAPYVAVVGLGDSSVDLVVRAWVKNEHRFAVEYDVYEKIYKQLPANGLHFPFPQLDVTIKK